MTIQWITTADGGAIRADAIYRFEIEVANPHAAGTEPSKYAIYAFLDARFLHSPHHTKVCVSPAGSRDQTEARLHTLINTLRGAT